MQPGWGPPALASALTLILPATMTQLCSQRPSYVPWNSGRIQSPVHNRTLPSLLATSVEHLSLRLPQELFLLQLQNSNSSVRRNTLKIPPSLPLCLGKYLALHSSASLGVSVQSVDQQEEQDFRGSGNPDLILVLSLIIHVNFKRPLIYLSPSSFKRGLITLT